MTLLVSQTDLAADKETMERLTGLADQLVSIGDYSILDSLKCPVTMAPLCVLWQEICMCHMQLHYTLYAVALQFSEVCIN